LSSATPDKRGTEEHPLVVKAAPGPATEEDRQRDARHASERAEDIAFRTESDRQRHTVDKWILGASLATALILVIQGIAFFVQAQEMHRSVQEMKASTAVAQQAAESAKLSADAAVSANTLSREALLAEHRPWVRFSVVPLSLRLTPSGWELVFNSLLENIGTAPALRVQFTAEMMPHILASWRADEGEVNAAEMLAQSTDIGAELQRFSAQVMQVAEQSPVFGALMFPRDRVTSRYTINRSDDAFALGLGRRGYSGQLLVLCGVTYKSAIDQSWHHTAIPFSVWPIGGQSAQIRPLDGRFEAGLGQFAMEPLPLADSRAT
jgi:hypothetical protein